MSDIDFLTALQIFRHIHLVELELLDLVEVFQHFPFLFLQILHIFQNPKMLNVCEIKFP